MTIQKRPPRALGKEIDPKTLQADLEAYRRLALELGAADTAIISAGDVTVDERVRLKCLVPRCLRAGETPNCPPNAPDLDLVRKAKITSLEELYNMNLDDLISIDGIGKKTAEQIVKNLSKLLKEGTKNDS